MKYAAQVRLAARPARALPATALLLTLLGSTASNADERGFRKRVVVESSTGDAVLGYEESQALIIGVSRYTNWPSLPGVQSDVRAVSAVLRKHGFEITTVQDPNSEELRDAFDDFIAAHGHKENARLLFYFAGHGHTLKLRYGDDMGYIVPSNAPVPSRDETGFKEKALDMQLIEVYAKRIEAKHAMFLFDSCFSGSIFSLSRAAPANISYKTAKPVRQFITAGGADETVPDESVFRRQFVSALEGEADTDDDGYITGGELGEYLQKQVVNYSRGTQHPQFGKIRNRNLDKGDLVFVSPQPKEVGPVRCPPGSHREGDRCVTDEVAAVPQQTNPVDACLRGVKKDGCAMVGYALLHGSHSSANDALRAAELLTGACRRGDAAACSEAGSQYLNGVGMTPNKAAANQFFRQGCDGGDAMGCWALGSQETGQRRASLLAKARDLAPKACSAGSARDCSVVGQMSLKGEGVPRDPSAAVLPLQRACDASLIGACMSLGLLLYSGASGVPRDQVQSAIAFRRACDGGIGAACRSLGMQLRDGAGVPIDRAQAFKRFQRACTLGDDDGCWGKAVALANGQGTARNEDEAMKLFSQLCGKRLATACHDEGVLAKRKGDLDRAQRAFDRACQLGDSGSCTAAERQRQAEIDRQEKEQKERERLAQLERERRDRAEADRKRQLELDQLRAQEAAEQQAAATAQAKVAADEKAMKQRLTWWSNAALFSGAIVGGGGLVLASLTFASGPAGIINTLFSVQLPVPTLITTSNDTVDAIGGALLLVGGLSLVLVGTVFWIVDDFSSPPPFTGWAVDSAAGCCS
jgi:TPR repeat protein